MKRPSFQFYPADWLNDIKLQSCSLETIGFMINLMCLMHQGEPYGYLAIGGQAIANKEAYRLAGAQHTKGATLLAQLLACGILAKDKKDRIYCPRMVKDEQLRETRTTCGKLGGNPNLLNQKVNQKDNHSVEEEDEEEKEDKEEYNNEEEFYKKYELNKKDFIKNKSINN